MCRNLVCMDSMCARNPESYGIESGALRKAKCLIETSGARARQIARAQSDITRVFVISSDDVDAINLAAAIKHDNSETQVNLVVSNPTGSLKSRTDACGIDRVVNISSLGSVLGGGALPEVENKSKVGKHQYFSPEDLDVDEPSFIPYIPAPFMQHDERLDQDIPSPFSFNSDCWIMSIFSGSGGAGKSTVSAISAQLFASLGYKTLLIDCDLQFGDLRNAFKNVNCASIDQVVEHPEKMGPLSDETSDGPCILQAPRSLESFEVVAPKINDLLAQGSQIFDVIVVNTGSCWSDVHANLMKISSLSLFLIDQRVSSVRGCKHAIELAERLNISSQSFKFALNRCGKKSALSAADVQPTFGVNDIFELAEGSLEVEEKMCLGAVMDLVKQRNPLSMSVFEMLKIACPLSIAQARKHERKQVEWAR